MKKVLVIINTSKNESLSLSKQIADFLKTKNIDCDFLNFDGFAEDKPFKDYGDRNTENKRRILFNESCLAE